jgi:hypothetical protein
VSTSEMEMPTIARARREPEVKAQNSHGGPLPAVLIIGRSPSFGVSHV